MNGRFFPDMPKRNYFTETRAVAEVTKLRDDTGLTFRWIIGALDGRFFPVVIVSHEEVQYGIALAHLGYCVMGPL